MIRAVCVLLLLGGLPGFLSQTINVWQIPVIWAAEGSSVTLPCNYNISGENATIGSYKWYRHFVNSVEVSENNENFFGRISRTDTDQFIHGRSAAITLHKLEVSDTGMYYCEVTFQIGKEVSGHGNGTFLNVTAVTTDDSSNPNLYIYGGVAGGVLLLAVLSAVVYCIYTKQACATTQDVGPIVYTDFMAQRSTNEAVSRLTTPQEEPHPSNSLYCMENQHYTYYEHKGPKQEPSTLHYQEVNPYSAIP